MSLTYFLLLLGVAGLIGFGLGYYIRFLIGLGKRGSLELRLKQMELSAKEESEKIVSEAKKKVTQLEETSKSEIKLREGELRKLEERLVKKEESIEGKQKDAEKEVEDLKMRIAEVKAIKDKTEEAKLNAGKELERVAGLSSEAAKEELISKVAREGEEDIAIRIQKLEQQGKEKLEQKARDILVAAIQRFGNSVAPDTMTSTVAIPSDEIKGKIIGREGRNIKAFERATGVEVLVDESPGVITLSSFDPVRRAIAKKALESLIADGRIQPAKIEELVQKAKEELNKFIREKGEQAAFECGIINLDPRIVAILGRLQFRTSYGQNVLQHSIEMAHIAGMLAEELGANVAVAKAGALLHDIGKAVDHEVQGTHVDIGRRILQKFGASEDIIKAMQAHHEEYPYETVESIIVQVADAISGGRPGARRDSVEQYLKKLGDLENIATSFPGVEKAYG
ncbi:MAG: ribonuclease Y, partial [Patescibacteria group bacterium]